MLFRGNEIEFNDLTKAHACVLTNTPSMVAQDIYQSIQYNEPVNILNIKVEPNEMASFMTELSSEIKGRKNILKCKNVTRVSDIKDEEISELRQTYITILLPRALSNRNLNYITDALLKSIPLNIHFILVTPIDADSKLIDTVLSSSYWELRTATNTLKQIDHSKKK